MPCGPRPAKVREWTERMCRFDLSGQTVRQFCQNESISTASFHRWKRILSDPAHRESSPPAATASLPRPSAVSFKQVLLAADPQPTACLTVRLADGVQLDLRSDLPAVEAVLARILDHAASHDENG